MDDVRLVDANALIKKLQLYYESLSPGVYSGLIRCAEVSSCIAALMDAPTINAQIVKRGHWSECFRDCRCISVICFVCNNPTSIAHGCQNADEITMENVIKKLPHCPKCCSDMRGDKE